MLRYDITLMEAAELRSLTRGQAEAMARAGSLPGAWRDPDDHGRVNMAGHWRVDCATLRATLPTAALRERLDEMQRTR